MASIRFASSKVKMSLPQILTANTEAKIKEQVPLVYREMRTEEIEGFQVHYSSLGKKISTSNNDSRTLWDSYLEVSFPLSNNLRVRSHFLRPNRQLVRFGRVFECLDSLAGEVAFRHALGSYHPNSGFTMVTASIEDIKFNDEDIRIDEDLCLKAYLTYVGKSSMDIKTEIYSGNRYIGEGNFVFVGLNSKTQTPTEVPKLVPSNTNDPILKEFEQKTFETGKHKAITRKEESNKSLGRNPPNLKEIEIIHRIWSNTTSFSNPLLVPQCNTDKEVFLHPMNEFSSIEDIENTKVISTQLMQHDHLNVHKKMFGGYLARKAFETSWLCAQKFFQTKSPKFIGVDNIQFKLPVEVGSMVENIARVTLCAKNEVHIQVDSVVIHPDTNERKLANVYHFFYQPEATEKPKLVIPKTYEQFVSYIDGRRRYLRRHSDHKSHKE